MPIRHQSLHTQAGSQWQERFTLDIEGIYTGYWRGYIGIFEGLHRKIAQYWRGVCGIFEEVLGEVAY